MDKATDIFRRRFELRVPKSFSLGLPRAPDALPPAAGSPAASCGALCLLYWGSDALVVKLQRHRPNKLTCEHVVAPKSCLRDLQEVSPWEVLIGSATTRLLGLVWRGAELEELGTGGHCAWKVEFKSDMACWPDWASGIGPNSFKRVVLQQLRSLRPEAVSAESTSCSADFRALHASAWEHLRRYTCAPIGHGSTSAHSSKVGP